MRAPSFIKMDIEGAEGDALEGAVRVLERHRPVLLIDLHSPEQDLRVGRVSGDADYRVRTSDGREVTDLGTPWPAPHGIWGQIIATPKKVDA